MKHYNLYIGGKWVDTEKHFDVIEKYTVSHKPLLRRHPKSMWTWQSNLPEVHSTKPN